MLRIGLCDDIADARLLLEDALERALEINGWEAQFFQFSSGEGLLDWYAKHLGELDLVQTLRELDEHDRHPTDKDAAAQGKQVVGPQRPGPDVVGEQLVRVAMRGVVAHHLERAVYGARGERHPHLLAERECALAIHSPVRLGTGTNRRGRSCLPPELKRGAKSHPQFSHEFPFTTEN